MQQSTRVILLGVICAAVGIGIGVLIGYYSNNGSEYSPPPQPTEDPNVGQKIMNDINPNNIETYLEFLSKEPHIAGRNVDEVVLVDYISNLWKDAGFEVEIHPYDVLLAYPKQEDSNYISVKLDNGTEIDKSQPSEKILDESQISDKVVNPFTAYSATGDAEGYAVYVNYARIDDFIFLTRNLNVNPAGHVCISRYGKIFRGSKASHAEQYGCIGLILYSDPADYTVPWASVYPEDWYLPGTGAQRGNLQTVKGDPLTPQYPAIDTAWRMKDEDLPLPHIPVTPIGYDDAIKYLRRMGGDEAPEDWRGKLNITYRLGPGFAGEINDTSLLKMHVTTKNERATAHNVIGYIRGSVEPDRYVILGNHRDAWVFGAIDPSSGTATMLELSRVYGKAVKEGWRPRRTIVFCSWGAEEYGIIGSTEWVEEFQKTLSSRSVAYLNVDIAVKGNFTLSVDALPNMNKVIYEAAKMIENPRSDEIEAGRKTVYDTWQLRDPKDKDDLKSLPEIDTLGSGSDFTPFVQVVGISAMHLSYTYDTSIGIASYPIYHSVYETLDLMKTFVDPGFLIHQAMARLWGEVGRRIIDSPILPFNCEDYAAKLIEDKDTMIAAYGVDLKNHDIDLDQLNDAMTDFTSAAQELHNRIDTVDTTNDFALRAINDQLMYLDRAFIDMNGIGERRNFRHVIYAPSLHNTYASSAFPGLVDSLFDIDADPDQEGRWEEVRRQYSILVYHIGSAASTMRDVVPIKGYSNLS